MFREMRRKKQSLSTTECLEILTSGEWGVLALRGDDDYPYPVPLNYVFHKGEIVFHSARAGHKVDAIERDKRASFCVVEQSTLVPEKFATAYRSVIVFGTMRKIVSQEERSETLKELVEALSGHVDTASKHAEINSCWMRDNVEMFALTPEHITGKQALASIMNTQQKA